jgi:hypothetical protein
MTRSTPVSPLAAGQEKNKGSREEHWSVSTPQYIFVKVPHPVGREIRIS